MTQPPTSQNDHGKLMDQTYRYQRLIYDVTRKYYLLGRDHLIENMDAKPNDRILEIACGTGRNLALIRKTFPNAKVYGLDISEQMLTTARAKLGSDVTLAQADACNFDPRDLFAVDTFDHIVLSYSLSMIPDWRGALIEAKRHLSPGGRLHVVDFGDCARLPKGFKRVLEGWLTRFHVTPRHELPQVLAGLTSAENKSDMRALYRGYAAYGQIQS